MAKHRFTDTQELSFGTIRESRNVSNVGTLTVSVWTGNEFIPSDILPEGAREYFTQGLRLKFEISAGDFYYIERGEQR